MNAPLNHMPNIQVVLPFKSPSLFYLFECMFEIELVCLSPMCAGDTAGVFTQAPDMHTFSAPAH